MRAIVVYESLFGNTRQVAEAVADGLRERGAEVELVPVAEAGDVEGADLLVVGGPTHAHGMVSGMTRRGAVDDARKHPERPVPEAVGPTLREWLGGLGPGDGRWAAAFDTRIDKPRILTGSAAHGIAKRLRRNGYDLVGEEGSFLVADTAGPMLDGELERARAWGAALAAPGG